MNKRYKLILISITLILVSSCKKNYESEPQEFITEDYIFDTTDPTGTYAQNFLTGIYTMLPAGFNRVNGLSPDCASDDAVPSDNGSATWPIIRGGYNPVTTFDEYWSNAYAGIRKSNIFLANYLKVPWADNSKKQWFPAEARFLRAFFYYEMIKRYGGIPIMDDKILSLSDQLELPRNSFEECVNYIVSECDAIQGQLRSDPVASGDGGHASKGAALALKMQVLLLAASPLYNGNAANKYEGYLSYDLERWKKAADAAKEVINLNVFILEPNRYNLFNNRLSRENIFYRQGGNNNNSYAYEVAPIGYNNVNNIKSLGKISPTQELVNAFAMKNGKNISEQGSGFDAANPYLNRDPRLDQTIFYNGQRWIRRSVETFDGGLDKPNSVTQSVQTRTGYYSKKFLANDAENTTYNNISPAWVYIRYAEVLLNYAEALNEYLSAPSAEVYTPVQQIRQRAGLAPFTLTSGLTKIQLREIIRKERRVELAFEDKRFWDIRRWKIAETVYGTMLHAIKITKIANGSLSYQQENLVQPFFEPKMYRLPISNGEILKNRNLVQNTGY